MNYHPFMEEQLSPANSTGGAFRGKDLYLTDKLRIIHFTRVGHGTMADYVLPGALARMKFSS
jgi:hypothetical protein